MPGIDPKEGSVARYKSPMHEAVDAFSLGRFTQPVLVRQAWGERPFAREGQEGESSDQRR